MLELDGMTTGQTQPFLLPALQAKVVANGAEATTKFARVVTFIRPPSRANADAPISEKSRISGRDGVPTSTKKRQPFATPALGALSRAPSSLGMKDQGQPKPKGRSNRSHRGQRPADEQRGNGAVKWGTQAYQFAF